MAMMPGHQRTVDTRVVRHVLRGTHKSRKLSEKQLGDDKIRTGVQSSVSRWAQSACLPSFASDMAFWKSGDADANSILLADEAH